MSTSASAPAVESGRTQPMRQWGMHLLHHASHRRVGLSTALFFGLIVADVLLWKTKPCNLANPLDAGTLAGELLVLLGLLIRTWAAGTILKCKELTTAGPYGLVRNPLYIGSFLMMFGFSLLMRDWIAMWMVLGPVLAMYLNRVRQEEVYLAHHYPESWPAYIERTPRFVPTFDRLPSLQGFSWQRWIKNQEFQAVGASILGLMAIWWWGRISG